MNNNDSTATLGDSLRNVADPTDENLEYLQQRFLEEINIPDEFTINDEIEANNWIPQLPGEENPPDYTLLMLWWPDENHYVAVHLLDGSHLIQLATEDKFYGPTYNSNVIDAQLKDIADSFPEL